MSLQRGPLFGHGQFLESAEPGGASAPMPPTPPRLPAPPGVSEVEHHAQPAPDEHLCTCGKIREACVHDEVRALWQSVIDAAPSRPPKS